MAISSRHLGWLERLAPRLFIDGRFCPIRAYRTRTVRGPVDRTLVVLVLAVIGLGVYRATVFYLSGK